MGDEDRVHEDRAAADEVERATEELHESEYHQPL
jgi:hypothetical protein